MNVADVLNCFLCQVNFPLCTIAHTPRLPEHCIEYVRILLWPKEEPFGSKTPSLYLIQNFNSQLTECSVRCNLAALNLQTCTCNIMTLSPKNVYVWHTDIWLKCRNYIYMQLIGPSPQRIMYFILNKSAWISFYRKIQRITIMLV